MYILQPSNSALFYSDKFIILMAAIGMMAIFLPAILHGSGNGNTDA